MAMLAILLALVQFTLIHGLPAPVKRGGEAIHEQAITLPSRSITTSYTSTVETFQSASATVEPSLTGSIQTGLPSDAITQSPLAPSATEPFTSLSPVKSTLDPGPTAPPETVAGNIFVPLPFDAPPDQISSRNDHVVKKEHIADEDVPIGTNKFYANFFLGSQGSSVWTHPYSLAWAKGRGETWGMAVTHVERNQFAWGQGSPPQYFIGPVGIQHIVFSAAELGSDTTLSSESVEAFSTWANLAPSPGVKPILSLPVVQGMGFVTALYDGAKPQINSGTFFRTMTYIGQLNDITYKYRITLEDSSEWLLYATPVTALGAPPFDLKNSRTIEGPEDFIGIIQVAKNPAKESGEEIYDESAGAFATNATISGSVDGNTGSYTIEWGKEGVLNQTLLMFGLPHQVESFDEKTKACLTDISLVTTTKGYAKAVRADRFVMIEPDLPTSIGFAPWVPSSNGGGGGSDNINLGPNALAAVNNAGAHELGQDFDSQTRLDSMYYSGKALAKFAQILVTIQDIAKNSGLAAAGLPKLKDAFNVFVNNTQPLPLVYDTVWKGVVSSGTYRSGDQGLDFGNTLYNDHHFHYGYFVYTASVIGYLDPSWLEQGTNKAWVNTLVRDFANPSTDDPYFPFQRAFDWYHCHSWAKGLFESGDGKDQESTSEDTFATYALKMWGKVTGDANMEARGNLQLACQARSLKNYFLLQSDNKVQPEQFLPNKVTGILFENKIDHTTYFGTNTEYIEGIHMIPQNPSSAYTRPRQFVQEEWDTYFANGQADKVQGGWKGILYANYALINPSAAYNYFADSSFDYAKLDGGASRTWYLAYSAAMMGSGTLNANEYEATVKPTENESPDQPQEEDSKPPATEKNIETNGNEDEAEIEHQGGGDKEDFKPPATEKNIETNGNEDEAEMEHQGEGDEKEVDDVDQDGAWDDQGLELESDNIDEEWTGDEDESEVTEDEREPEDMWLEWSEEDERKKL